METVDKTRMEKSRDFRQVWMNYSLLTEEETKTEATETFRNSLGKNHSFDLKNFLQSQTTFKGLIRQIFFVLRIYAEIRKICRFSLDSEINYMKSAISLKKEVIAFKAFVITKV